MKKINIVFTAIAFLLSGFCALSICIADDSIDKAILKLDGKVLTEEAKKADDAGNSALAGKLYFKLAEYYELKAENKKSSQWDESEKILDKAIESLRKAADEKGEYETHFELARALIYRIRHYDGMFDLYQIITKGQETTKEIEVLKKTNPEGALAELALGIQTLHKPENMGGGIAKAIPHFEKAQKTATDNPEVLYWFARAYSLDGAAGRDTGKAVEYLKQAIAMNPEDSRYEMELKKISAK